MHIEAVSNMQIQEEHTRHTQGNTGRQCQAETYRVRVGQTDTSGTHKSTHTYTYREHPYVHGEIHTYMQAGRQAYIQADGQTIIQAGRHIYRQTGPGAENQANIPTGRHTETASQRGQQANREAEQIQAGRERAIRTYRKTTTKSKIHTYIHQNLPEKTDIHAGMHQHRQTHTGIHIQTHACKHQHTYIHTHIHTGRQTGRHTYRHTVGQAYTNTYIHTET